MQRPRREHKESAARTRSQPDPHLVDVIVLTADPALLATLREASGPSHQLLHAQSADAAVELLVSGHHGILVIDVAVVGRDVANLIDKLQAQFPEIILLATGRRNEQNAVAGLVGSGRIYRFLHKPVSPARAELFLSAATRRYGEMHPQVSRSASAVRTLKGTPPRHFVLIAVALALVASGAWLSSQRRVPPTLKPTIVEVRQPATDEIANLLVRADSALAAGRLAPPVPNNAFDAYRSVLRLDPAHREAAAAIDDITDTIEQQVETALSKRDAQASQLAQTSLRLIASNHPRLAAFQDGLAGLTRKARPAPPATPTSGIAAASPTPAIKPGNTHVDRAKAYLAANQLLEPADASETSLPDVELLAARIHESQNATQAAALRDRVSRISQLRTSGQLIEPAGDNAYELLQALIKELPDAPEVRNERQQLSFALLERTRTALAAGEVDQADVLATRAEETLAGLPQTKALREQIGDARQQRDDVGALVQAATLPRRREVPAVYPREALLREIEGWVDLEFTISAEGVPDDVIVKSADPAQMFDNAALIALRQWHFEPVVREGAPRAQRATLRMEFKLQE